jgi:hypothetical protein
MFHTRPPVTFREWCGHVSLLKTHTFDWGNLGQFYPTMVAPYRLTYAGLYAVDLFVPEERRYDSTAPSLRHLSVERAD